MAAGKNQPAAITILPPQRRKKILLVRSVRPVDLTLEPPDTIINDTLILLQNRRNRRARKTRRHENEQPYILILHLR